MSRLPVSASNTRLILAASVAATALLGGAAPAFAQGAASAAVEELVVTAQRREERLQDIPISITALSADSLEDRGVVNIKGITAYVPNVELTSSSRPTAGGSSYAAFIRGVGNGDYAFPTDPAIGLYVDGVYMARPLGGLLSIADIERIEVLRGPQGTLYGRNTLGGAISVVTSAPELTGELTGSLMARAGSYGKADFVNVISGPIIDGRLGGKLSLGLFTRQGWGERILTGENVNGERRFVARGGLLFQAAPNLTIDVRADYSRQRQNGIVANYVSAYATPPALIQRYNTFAAPALARQIGLPTGSVYGPAFASSDPYKTYSASPLQDDFDMGGVSVDANWAISDAFNLRSITAYRDLKTHIQVDGDGAPFEISSTNEKFADQTISQEFQASGDLWGGRLHYLVGAYFFREKGSNFKHSYSFHGVYEVTGLAADARDTYTFQEYEATSYALFTQNEFKLTDQLTLVAGGRVTKDEKDFEVLVTLPQRGGVVSVPRQSRNKDWTSFTPRLGLNWKPTEDVLIYGSYSKGFKSGGFGSPTATAAAPVYDPEELIAYEVGAKTTWLDRRLVANVAAFWSEWDDIQLSVIVPGPTGGVVNVTQNAGAAELYGFEAELTAVPTDGLTLNLGVGYTKHKLTSLAPGARTAGLTLSAKLPHVPEWTINPGIQYAFSTGLGDIKLGVSAAYRSDQFLTINDATSFEDAYTLVNARASINPAGHDNLELAIEGTNLTDEVYLTYNQNATLFGIQANVPGDPRLINVSARIKF